MRREVLAGLRRNGRSIPSERARSSWRRRLAVREQRNRLRTKQLDAVSQHGGRELHQVGRVREHTRVPGDPTHYAGIFVVYLSLNHASAKLLIIDRGWNGLA